MTTEDRGHQTVLVISDDDELGALLALNLRRRHVSIEQIDFLLAASPIWSPACIRPGVVLIIAERITTDPIAFLRATRERPWLADAHIVLAADNSARQIAKLGNPVKMIATALDDVGAIVAATLSHVPYDATVPHLESQSAQGRFER